MKEERRRFTINLNRRKDADIIGYLEAHESMQRVIIDALRDYMRKDIENGKTIDGNRIGTCSGRNS